MGISPIELQGMYARTQDFSILKQQEDQKTEVNQNLFQNELIKEEQKLADRVSDTQKSDQSQLKKDAREKGDNEYNSDGGRNRKNKKDAEPDGRVIRKSEGGHFECRI